MRKSFLPVLLVAVLLLGACSSVQAPAAPTVAPTLAPTPAPTPEPPPRNPRRRQPLHPARRRFPPNSRLRANLRPNRSRLKSPRPEQGARRGSLYNTV